MKKKLLFVLMFSFFLAASSIAQEYSLITNHAEQSKGIYKNTYQKALGVKMYPSAISYKQFIRSNKAIEVLGYFTLDGFRGTLMYEKYSPINDVDQLSWYVGYGGHIGLWSEEWKRNNPSHSAGIALGVDGILGLDYKIKNAPLNFSIDWQPSFNFVGASYFESGWAGIGIRYTF